jgi:hypothetical protein
VAALRAINVFSGDTVAATTTPTTTAAAAVVDEENWTPSQSNMHVHAEFRSFTPGGQGDALFTPMHDDDEGGVGGGGGGARKRKLLNSADGSAEAMNVKQQRLG